MKIILAITTLIILANAPAFATTCYQKGNGSFICEVGDKTYHVNNANSKAEAEAAAVAFANQQQGQAQSSENTNSNRNNNINGGNSVSIEGDPAHTTSMNLGVGINFSVPIASGVQTRNAIDTANWFLQNGDRCTAFHIMSKAPRVRNLKINFNCGDKG